MANFKRQRIYFWVIYIFVFLLIIFFILELAARLLKLAPQLTSHPLGGWKGNVEDPYLPYKPTPFRKVHVKNSEFEIDYQYNSMGFRDVEHSFQKPEGVFRILGLGDSFTEGAGVNFTQTYLYRLEKMLNERKGNHPKVEIIKAGIGGYYPESERILLQHYGVKYEPDLILVGFLANDVCEAYMGLGARTVSEDGYLTTNEAAQLGKLGRWLYIHSHLLRIFLAKYVNNQIRNKYKIDWSEIWYDNERSEKAWEIIEKEFYLMRDIAENIGAKIVFLHIPQQPNPIKGWGKSYWTYPSLKLYQWTKRADVEFLDVLPEMKNNFGRKQLYYQKDGHCTAEGYKIIAQAVYKQLEKKGLVP